MSNKRYKIIFMEVEHFQNDEDAIRYANFKAKNMDMQLIEIIQNDFGSMESKKVEI